MDRFKASIKGKINQLAPKLQTLASDTYNKIKEMPT